MLGVLGTGALVATGRLELPVDLPFSLPFSLPSSLPWPAAAPPPPPADTVRVAPPRAPISVPIARGAAAARGDESRPDKVVTVERGAAFVGDVPRRHVQGADSAPRAGAAADSSTGAPDPSRLTVPGAADGALGRAARDIDARVFRADSVARDTKVKLPAFKPGQ